MVHHYEEDKLVSDLRPDIWRLQAKFDTQGLIDALSNADPGIRKRAAAALRALGATEAVSHLKAVLATERNPDTREAIVAALAAIEPDQETSETEPVDLSHENALTQWIEKLNSSDPEQIVEAAQKLADLHDKRGAEPLVVVFNNKALPARVRLAVAEALLQLESAPVEVALLKALRSAKWRVRRNGAAILGQMRATWAVVPLAQALRDENEVVRRTALAALRRLESPEAKAVLDKLRTSELPRVENDTRSLNRPTQPNPNSAKRDVNTEHLAGLVTSLARQGGTLENTRPSKRGPMPDVKTERLDSSPAPTQPLATSPSESTAPTAPSTPTAPTTPSDPTVPSRDMASLAAEMGKKATREIEETHVGKRGIRPDDDTQRMERTRLTWPKRQTEPPLSSMPTKPLDPKRLEEAEERLNRKKAEDQDKNS